MLAALTLIACVCVGLTAFSLGLGPDAPLPREAAMGRLVLAGVGALGFRLVPWALTRHLNRAAQTGGRG